MALFELKSPNIEYVYSMTWAEFRIRLFAYKRAEKKAWYHTREICYQVYISNWMSKKKPISKEAYMRLEEAPDKPLLNQAQIDRIEQVKIEYLNEIKENGGRVRS